MFTYTHTHAPIHKHATHSSTHTRAMAGRFLQMQQFVIEVQHRHNTAKRKEKKLESNQKIVEQLPMQPLPCGRRRLLQSCCCCVPKSTTKHIAHGNNTKKQPCKPSQARPSRAESSRAEPKPNALSFTINARPTVARRSRS